MALISIHNGQLAFGDHPLLDKADFSLQQNERVCLVGRNGAGKSTMMKVLSGEIIMDDGKIQITQDVVVSRLEQDPPRNAEGTVYDYVAEGVAEVGALLKEYHHQLDIMMEDPSEKTSTALLRFKSSLTIMMVGAWKIASKISLPLYL